MLLTLFCEIADAVNSAHLKGAIHGDLKPANIIIDGRGEPYLLDFDLAHTAVSQAIDGHFIGSIPWAAPEQADKLRIHDRHAYRRLFAGSDAVLRRYRRAVPVQTHR